MLFYARDGFCWAAVSGRCGGVVGPQVRGRRRAIAGGGRRATLPGARRASSGCLETPCGARRASRCGTPTRAARSAGDVAPGLASPFLDGGRQQAEANAGLTDLLLAPPNAAGDAMRRVLHNAPTPTRRMSSTRAVGTWSVSVGHVLTRRPTMGAGVRARSPARLQTRALRPLAAGRSALQAGSQRSQPRVPLAADLGDPSDRLGQRLRASLGSARRAPRARDPSRPACASVLRCLTTAWREIGRSPASSVAVAGCAAIVESRRRRVGSARALNTAPAVIGGHVRRRPVRARRSLPPWPGSGVPTRSRTSSGRDSTTRNSVRSVATAVTVSSTREAGSSSSAHQKASRPVPPSSGGDSSSTQPDFASRSPI